MPNISPEAIRAQLDRITASSLFVRSERMSRFLRYTTEMALTGHAGDIKEYRIGTDVFDRRDGYDPRLDPIVRVEARRLRQKLCQYYETEGRGDPVVIEFDKGSYVPRFRPSGAAVREVPPAPPQIRALAVLPFSNLGPEPANEYLSDGLTEELIHALTRLEGLRVVAWNSAARLRHKEHDIAAIAEQLHVAAVLTGSVQLAGGRLRVRTQLIDAATSIYLWSETYDREVQDIFRIQEEIARAIVRTLRVELEDRFTAAPIARGASKIDSYELYLKGRYHWNKRTQQGLLRSVQFFKSAIALDDHFALAYAGLADAYSLVAEYAAAVPSETMPLAREAAARAIELDPNLAEAWTSLAFIRSVFDWEWEEAEELYSRAISLNPGYATAHHWLAGDFLAMLGRFDEAMKSIERAMELDPLSSILQEGKGMILMLSRRYEAAAEHLQLCAKREPGFFKFWTTLGRVAIQSGRYAEAIEALERGRVLAGELPSILAAMGQAYAFDGRPEEARRMLDRLAEQAKVRYVPCASFALVHAALGEKDAALGWLEKGCDAHETPMLALRVHPIYDPLRDEARFQEMLRKMRLA